jgi:hypothetical protein
MEYLFINDDKLTVKDLLEMDVFDERFNITFTKMLDKFVSENDDMSIMGVQKAAMQLQKAINEL